MYKEHTLVLNVLDNTVTLLQTNVTQNDSNTNRINITLIGENNKPLDFTAATKITVSIIKSNGNLVEVIEGANLVIASRAKGKISLILPGESVTVPGICQGTVDLFKGDNRLTSSRFSYNVLEDINNSYSGKQVEENTLASLIKATQNAANSATSAANSATSAANSATSAANSATSAIANIPTTITNTLENGTFNSLNTQQKKFIPAINEILAALNGEIYNTLDADYTNGWARVVGSSISLSKKGNIVFISGMINGSSGTLASGTAILNLSKFPPKENARIQMFATSPSNNLVGLVSQTDKVLKLQSTATATSYFINGFYFTT